MQSDVVSRRNRTFTVPNSHAERGVALVVSLVLLVAITIMGVATLSGTRLNELIASNTQQKTVAFEAAESAIESVSRYDILYTAITSDEDDSGDDPAIVMFDEDDAQLAQRYDLDDTGINISGTLGAQYCGETQPFGTNLSATLDGNQITALMVDVNSQIAIANSGARADHLRRVSFLAPQTGRTGNCPVRN